MAVILRMKIIPQRKIQTLREKEKTPAGYGIISNVNMPWKIIKKYFISFQKTDGLPKPIELT